jgi:hypothetical protein
VRVIGDPDPAETCKPEKFSNLSMGLGGWNGNRWPLSLVTGKTWGIWQYPGKSRLSFGKPYVLPFTKGREGGVFLPYNLPELVQPTEDHLHTGVCSHAGWPRKPLGWMQGPSQR